MRESRRGSDSTRDDRPDQPCRIAVICMVPDVGHLLPLLKLAAQVRGTCEIAVFVPQELAALVASSGFRAVVLPPVRPQEGLPSLRRYVGASEAWRIVRAYPESQRRYLRPLIERIRANLPRLAEALAGFRPHSILADDHPHAFGGLRELLPTLGAEILFHSADSVFARHHDTWSLKSCYWDGWRSAATDAFAKTANEIALLNRGLKAPRPLAVEDAPSAPPPLPKRPPRRLHRLSSGTSLLEQTLLGPRLLPHPPDRLVVASPPPLGNPMAGDLAEWLEQSDGDVVYVSFGTMAAPPDQVVAGIVDAVLGQGLRVLLQHAGTLPPRAGLRQEPWVEQTAVLGHEAVRLFVTHGGAGSVQEALWFGKPMVCLPAAWDHYYNAWVVNLLGAGVRLRHNRAVRAGRLARTVRAGMRDEHARQARALSALMRAQWDAHRTFVQDLIMGRGRAARPGGGNVARRARPAGQPR